MVPITRTISRILLASLICTGLLVLPASSGAATKPGLQQSPSPSGSPTMSPSPAPSSPAPSPSPTTSSPTPGPSSSPTSPPGRADTELRLSVSDKVVRVGQTVAVSVRLRSEGDVTGASIEVFGKRLGGQAQSLGVFQVSEQGLFVGEIQMLFGTTFEARFAGNERLQPSRSNTRTVKVRPIVQSALDGFYDRSGKHKLYHQGDPVIFSTRVNPPHPRMKVGYVIQRRVGDRWKVTDRAEFRMDDEGLSAGQIRLVRRGLYRTRAVFEGDVDHLRAASRWRTLVITV